MKNTEIFIDRRPGFGGYHVWICVNGPGGKRSNASAIILDEIKDEMQMASPVLTLSPGELQGMLDQIWMLGIRPSEHLAPAPQLNAMQAHLADMRKMVSKAYKVEL